MALGIFKNLSCEIKAVIVGQRRGANISNDSSSVAIDPSYKLYLFAAL
jgi:hypothetical protein